MVQLKKFEKQFADLETEVIVVFREDRKQVEGLKITKKKTQAPFTVLDDLGSQQTKVYSIDGFDTFIIGKDGTIKAKLDGVKKTRPGGEPIIAELQKLKKEPKK